MKLWLLFIQIQRKCWAFNCYHWSEFTGRSKRCSPKAFTLPWFLDFKWANVCRGIREITYISSCLCWPTPYRRRKRSIGRTRNKFSSNKIIFHHALTESTRFKNTVVQFRLDNGAVLNGPMMSIISMCNLVLRPLSYLFILHQVLHQLKTNSRNKYIDPIYS